MRDRMTKVAGVLALALTLAAAAAGQPSNAAIVVEAEVPATQPLLPPALLYDQTDSPAGVGFISQDFEAGNSAFDSRAADDFTVPAVDIQWDVVNLEAVGSYISGAGPTPMINVEFFADGGGAPGASACSYPGLVAGIDYTDQAGGSLKIKLPSVCSLPAGDYWVSVQADMDSTVGGQWLWGERSAPAGAPFVWENPPNGFGTGCVTWTPAGGCGASQPALLFNLTGAIVPVELQSITID